jgi:hypothetical protein
VTGAQNTYRSPREGSRRAREALERNLPAGVFEELDCGRGRGFFGRLRRRRPFKWFRVKPLWISRNDRIAHNLHDPIPDMRRRGMKWIGEQRGAPLSDADLVIDERGRDGRTSFLVLGDTGEGDTSQCVVVPPLLEAGRDTRFMVICSDVVYPTGDVNDYPAKFYEPYRDYDRPIYGIPGNHDWYDELEGFMHHLCRVPAPPRDFEPVEMPAIARLLWRRPRRLRAHTEEAREGLTPAGRRPQVAPYFAIDTGPVLVVCIDTGISGQLDRDQGDWLARVSREIDKPKILLTGKPLYVDGQYRPGVIERFNSTVDDIVREPAHRYVAAIGGDIHNYQRYPVCLADGRTIEYLVTGGGGAFAHATHRIGTVDLGGATEDGTNPDPERGNGFRCFPLRGASLQFYTRVVKRELGRLLRDLVVLFLCSAAAATGLLVGAGPRWWAVELAVLLALPAVLAVAGVAYLGRLRAFRILFTRAGVTLTSDQASRWIAEKLDSSATLEPRQDDLSEAQRDLANLIYPRFRRTRGVLHAFFSEIFDIDDPPLYKQFLRIDADEEAVVISCFAAIGTEVRGEPPALEDQVRIPLRDPVGAGAGAPRRATTRLPGR